MVTSSYITINIPVAANGTTKQVTFAPKLVQLGDNYQQVTGSNIQTPDIKWQFVSAFTDYTTVQGWIQQIQALGGGTPFYINVGGTVGLILVYCTEYSIEYTSSTNGQLLLTCTQIEGGEYLALKNNIAVTNFPTKINAAYTHITTNSTAITAANQTGYILIDYTTALFCHNFFYGVYADYGYDVDTHYNACLADDQIMFVRAMIDAYVAGVSSALSLAASAINSLWQYFMPSVSDPCDGATSYFPPLNPSHDWLPHNRFALRGSVSNSASQGNTSDPHIFYGYITATITFTRVGSTAIFTGGVGSTLVYVGNVWNPTAGLYVDPVARTGQNMYAPVQNPTPDCIYFYVDYLGRNLQRTSDRYFVSVSPSSIGGTYAAGTIGVNLPGVTASTISLSVSYALQDSLSPWRVRVDNFPVPRTALSTEFNFSFKYVNELLSIHSDMYQHTGQSKYNYGYLAISANIQKAISLYSTIQPITYPVFKMNTTANAWYTDQGINSRAFGGAVGSGSYTFRETSGGRLAVQINAYTLSGAANEYRLCNSAIQAIWQSTTTLSVDTFSSINNILYVYVHLDTSLSPNNTYVAAIATPATTDVNITLTYADFKGYFTSTGYLTPWYAGQQVLANAFSVLSGTATFANLNVAVGINDPVGVTTQPLVNQLTMTTGSIIALNFVSGALASTVGNINIAYRLVSGSIWIIVIDGSGNYFYYPDASPGAFKYPTITPSMWIPITSGATFNPNAAITGVRIQAVAGSVAQILYIGAIPTTIPITVQSYEISFGDRNNTAHGWDMGNVTVSNPANNYLRYTPGVVPLRLDRDTNTIYQLEPTIGNQFLSSLKKIGQQTAVDNVMQFYLDSQAAFTAGSSNGTVGLFYPVFRWERFDDYPLLPTNVWDSTVGSFPYVNAGHHSFHERAVLDIATYWYQNPKDARASKLVMNYLNWLLLWWTASSAQRGNPPFIYYAPNGSSPTYVTGNYPNVAGSALCMKCAIWANLAGGDALITYQVIQACYAFLESCYIPSGSTSGTWTNGQQAYSGFNLNQPDQMFEPITAYVLLWQQIANLTMPTVAVYNASL